MKYKKINVENFTFKIDEKYANEFKFRLENIIDIAIKYHFGVSFDKQKLTYSKYILKFMKGFHRGKFELIIYTTFTGKIVEMELFNSFELIRRVPSDNHIIYLSMLNKVEEMMFGIDKRSEKIKQKFNSSIKSLHFCFDRNHKPNVIVEVNEQYVAERLLGNKIKNIIPNFSVEVFHNY